MTTVSRPAAKAEQQRIAHANTMKASILVSMRSLRRACSEASKAPQVDFADALTLSELTHLLKAAEKMVQEPHKARLWALSDAKCTMLQAVGLL